MQQSPVCREKVIHEPAKDKGEGGYSRKRLPGMSAYLKRGVAAVREDTQSVIGAANGGLTQCSGDTPRSVTKRGNLMHSG